MQQILIPEKRAKLLDKPTVSSMEKRMKCKIAVIDTNSVQIEGEPYDEYLARNVVAAFGRGFELKEAYLLLGEEYYFNPISLKEFFGSKDQIARIKARIIGTDGKTKEYIESVSGAKLCIYESSVSTIGTIEQNKIANVAIHILIEGGTHKKAYRIMEKARRESRQQMM